MALRIIKYPAPTPGTVVPRDGGRSFTIVKDVFQPSHGTLQGGPSVGGYDSSGVSPGVFGTPVYDDALPSIGPADQGFFPVLALVALWLFLR